MRADSIWINRIKKAYRKRARNAIVIDILGGGAGLLGVFFSVRMRGDITILTDVSGELCKFAQDYARIPIHFLLPLCEHETTQSLLTQFYGKDHPAHSRIGIALATEGMAQCGGTGACAGMLLLLARLFAELLKNLSDEIMKLSGGNLHHLWLRSFGSGSGGTYSLFEVLLTAALVEHLTTLGVTIKVSFFMVDSMAFVGLGQNIHKNQACALAAIKDLIRTNATTKNDKVIYELRLIGTPPTGTDTQLRQEYKLLDQQAWLCPEMLQHLQVGGHNGVVVGPYGNICHTSTDFFRSIPRRLIASTVATEYYFAIKEGVEAILPMRDFIVGIEPNHIVIDSPRTAIPSIVDDCDRLTTNDMLGATIRPGDIHSYEFSVINASGEEYKCDLISEHFTNPPMTLREAIHNATIVETIHAVIREELDIVMDEIAVLNKDIAKQERRTLTAYKKVQSAKRFVEMAKKRALRDGNNLRRLADQLTVRLAMKRDIEKSIRSLVREVESQTSRLTGITQILEQHRRKGRTDDLGGLFYFGDVNEAFSDLLTLSSLDDERRQLVLAAQALAVTADGIQYILDATTNTVEELASRAIGPATTTGAWPGGIQKLAARTIYVLPPTTDELSSSFKNAITALAPNALVYVSDSVEFGMNIVRFHVFSPESESELLPGLLAKAYQDARVTPLDVLHRLPPSAKHDQSPDSQ